MSSRWPGPPLTPHPSPPPLAGSRGREGWGPAGRGGRGRFPRAACGERVRARVRGASIQWAVEAGGDVEIFRIVRPQEPVPQREVEDNQIDVELEVVARADAVEDRRGRHQLEMDDLAVLV